eukprot:c6575_g1_i2.p1 GENE.c6575_g1_i2~~c6575_g1_i2.p1  ORF type:complete len:205 (+),score=47.71 c6575_g1_i2:67-681(+)
METWIDSLPYIDTQYGEPGMKELVERMIKDEMKAFRPTKDYLSHLPLPQLNFENSAFLQSEFERVSRGEPMAAMDISRYQLERPNTEQWNDLNAWTRAVENAKAQKEHQQLRLMNLELLHRYGPNMLLKQNEQLSQLNTRYDAQVAEVKAQIAAINRKRKVDQTQFGQQLQQLDAEFLELCSKNVAIETACEQLKSQLAKKHCV